MDDFLFVYAGYPELDECSTEIFSSECFKYLLSQQSSFEVKEAAIKEE